MKILTFSFDDCEIHDRRLCELLRGYGIKATFYLISGQLSMKVPFHRYGEDTMVERVSAAEIPETYRGMEVASHTREHRLTDDMTELHQSLEELSRAWGQEVRGLAYPGGYYTKEQAEMLRSTPVCYARGAAPTHGFALPEDWYAWQPTCHYAEEIVPELIERFLAAPAQEDMLFHLYGHSYELTNPEGAGGWEHFERTLQCLSGRDDIVYATNLEAWKLLKDRRNL